MRIALSDPDADVSRAVACWLRHMGHEPVETAGGEDLLELCVSDPPDLALVNVQQPGSCGIEAAAWLLGASVPVVLMSAAWGYDDLVRAGRLRVPCIPKPFEPLDLVLAIAQATG